MAFEKNKIELESKGFSILDNIYSEYEINQIITCLENTKKQENSILKTKDLFAIRQLLNTVPELKPILFNDNLKKLLSKDYFLTKAIYFDKPSESNWFVAYHQDLSISVENKIEKEDYKNWTFKKGQHGVQPPINILQNTITIRIHLDDTTSENGALRVIPTSHLKEIYRPETIDWNKETESSCEINKGGVMLMKPLILHASSRTTNDKQRRVIHLEFCNQDLESPLNWLEKLNIA